MVGTMILLDEGDLCPFQDERYRLYKIGAFQWLIETLLRVFPTLKGISSLKFFVNVYEFLIPIFIFTICYYMEFEWISYV